MHSFTIKELDGEGEGTIHVQLAFNSVAELPPIPRQGDTVIWDDCLPGRKVHLVEHAYLRDPDPGFMRSRRVCTQVTVWVSR